MIFFFQIFSIGSSHCVPGRREAVVEKDMDSNPAPPQKNESPLRCQVELLRQKQNQVLESLKTCNIKKEELVVEPPDIVMSFLKTKSAADGASKRVEPNEYNFMSSAKRKFAEAQTIEENRSTPESEVVVASDEKSILALSEGPILSDNNPSEEIVISPKNEALIGEELVPVRDTTNVPAVVSVVSDLHNVHFHF